MKKWIAMVLALSMTCSLVGCSAPQQVEDEKDTPSTSQVDTEKDDSPEETTPDIDVSDVETPQVDIPQLDDPQIDVPDTAQTVTSEPIVVYISDDVVVFELTDPAVADLALAQQDITKDTAVIFKLGLFETSVKTMARNDEPTCTFYNEWTGAGVSKGVDEYEPRIDWELNGNTVRIICRNHQLDETKYCDSYLNVRVLVDYQDIYTGGQFMDEIYVTDQIPEQYAQPYVIENDYQLSDFPGVEHFSMISDDYMISTNVDSGFTQIIYFDELGEAFYLEEYYYMDDLTYMPDPGVWPDENGQPSGRSYYDNHYVHNFRYIQDYPNKAYSFWMYVGYNFGGYNQDGQHIYFSIPELPVSQMTDY